MNIPASSELACGCVCCELAGEFIAAVTELLMRYRPDMIVVEATGVAEADALVYEVEDELPEVRLDSVICVVDAFTSIRHPRVGHVGRVQLQQADIVLINKSDLVTGPQMEEVIAQVRIYNSTADIGFPATGRTAEEMLIAAADATMSVMVERLDDIVSREIKHFKLEATSLELALFDLLQELIFYKDAEELLLRVTRFDIATVQDRIVLSAEAQGEKIDLARHRLLVDVKAVTLHCFRVDQTPEGWSATVVLDI